MKIEVEVKNKFALAVARELGFSYPEKDKDGNPVEPPTAQDAAAFITSSLQQKIDRHTRTVIIDEENNKVKAQVESEIQKRLGEL